ncbi:MAG: flagellar biosynthesis protein FlhA, partial [Myxococcota bacterium]
LNLSIAALVFVVVLLADRPLAVSSFPSLLLITTLFRLALNVSSTRLILSEARGSALVEAFGRFVAKGDVAVGAVMFAILTLVQLLVVGKGAERVAEVGARFTLDALPGRQMSIDASARSGALSEAEAEEQRRELQRESQFHGAMDGAMKFVKGDAIAGLVITALDLVVGTAIGVFREGMGLAEAVSSFGLLTIGDGLVAQVPALLVTLAAGMLVTRVGGEADGGDLGRTLIRELAARPEALGLGGLFCLGLAAVPGLPSLPFGSCALAWLGFALYSARRPLSAPAPDAKSTPRSEQHLRPAPAQLLQAGVPALGIDLSEDLAERFGLGRGRDARTQLMAESLPKLRAAIFSESGVRLPAVDVQWGAPELDRGQFRIRVRTQVVEEGWLPEGKALACADPSAVRALGLPAEPARHPVHGGASTWIEEGDQQELLDAGTQVWLGPGYVTLHLAKAARKHLSLFVGIQSVSEIVDDFGRQSGALVQEVVPAQVSLPRLARVLRALIEEGVSIRDIGAILDALAEAPSEDLNAQVEAARAGLGARWMGRGPLPVLTLAPELEARIHASLRDVDGQVVCTLSEGERGGLTESVLAALSPRNDALVVTHAGIRRSLQRLLQPHRPDLQVVSYAELLPGVMVESIGRIDGGALMSPPSP